MIALIKVYQPLQVDKIAHPLGIMSLEAFLRENGRSDIYLFDMRLDRETPDQIMDRVRPLQPQVIGLSGLSVERDCVHLVARAARKACPGATVVVGGPYATASACTILKDECVDYVVVGEGEETFRDLLEQLEAGGEVDEIPGLAHRVNGDIVVRDRRPPIADVNSLPMPGWDRIDFEAYNAAFCEDRFTGGRWASIVTSRGCPYGCIYCHDTFGKRFRPRSPAAVLDEMRYLVKRQGVYEFLIWDDIFNFDKSRVIEICDGIVANGWDVRLSFPNGIRVDIMDREVLEALKAAGTYRICYAIESASPRIQKRIGKRLDLEKAERIIRMTDGMDILTHGCFMIGFPGETRGEIIETIRMALRLPLHTAGFYLVCPYDGTLLKEKFLCEKDAHDMSFDFYDSSISLAEVSARELRNLQRLAYIGFHLNPFRLARLIRLIPRKKTLLDIAPVFWKILCGREGARTPVAAPNHKD